MTEPIITLGENGELDQDEDGNIVLRNTATGVAVVLTEVLEIAEIETEDVRNIVETSGDVGISHRYFFGPDDPLDDPEIEVQEGDVWYDTSDIG